MKKLYSCIMLLTMMVAALSLTACGGDDDGDGGYDFKQDYDVLQINGVQYALLWLSLRNYLQVNLGFNKT